MGGVSAKYVMITADTGVNRNWSGGVYSETGWDEVRWSIFDPATNKGWKIDASGDWNIAANWKEGTPPNGAGATAILGDKITMPRTVYSDVAISVSTLQFNNASSYQIAGQGSLSMIVGSGTALIDVVQGSHKI